MTVLSWNQSCERVTGIRAEDSIGTRFNLSCIVSTHIRRLTNTIRCVFTGESFSGLELDFVSNIGRVTPMVSRAYPVINDLGKVVECVLANTDVSDLRLAQEASQENEAKYRHLSEIALEGIAIHERGKILEANSQFFEMFGYEPHEMIFKDAIPIGVAPEHRDLVKRQVESDSEEPYEVVGVRKDGTRFPMEVRARSWNFRGKLVRAAVMRDITERKYAEQQLRHREELLKHILDASPVGIGYVEDRRIGWGNRCMVDMFGFDREDDYLGRSTRVLYQSDEEYRQGGQSNIPGLKLRIGCVHRYRVQKKGWVRSSTAI